MCEFLSATTCTIAIVCHLMIFHVERAKFGGAINKLIHFTKKDKKTMLFM